ncbi:hypothetical protein CAPTEDRAFT_191594 [Capitella teleta]|uniref:G-protein coupled receptors family 1 profile domain-containing protein n=1 Tax=Capitella teleta TaxID=283909 RepID=R7T3S7_CAPTE|nr:hypothetical protein CAPTEDRAFT_191594 [Capitella teleta]|eukprot:ELT87403.1 hypothetical protein CAPTEDRAFT_191594 [Capitella teleta]
MSQRVERALSMWLPCVVLLLSLVAGVLTIVGCLRLHRCLHPLCAYLVPLVVVDWMRMLCLVLGSRLVGIHFLDDLMNKSDVVCGFVHFCRNFFDMGSAWLLVGFMLDGIRYAVEPRVVIPRVNLHRELQAMALLLVACFVCNAHHFWLYSVINVDVSPTRRLAICTMVSRDVSGKFSDHISPMHLHYASNALSRYLPMAVSVSTLAVFSYRKLHSETLTRAEVVKRWRLAVLDAQSLWEVTNLVIPLCVVCRIATSLMTIICTERMQREIVDFSSEDIWQLTSTIVLNIEHLQVVVRYVVLMTSWRRFRGQHKCCGRKQRETEVLLL